MSFKVNVSVITLIVHVSNPRLYDPSVDPFMWSGFSVPHTPCILGAQYRFTALVHRVRHKGLLLQHTVEVEGRKGIDAPLQWWGRAAQAERGEVKGFPPLGEDVVVILRRPGRRLSKRALDLSKGALGRDGAVGPCPPRRSLCPR